MSMVCLGPADNDRAAANAKTADEATACIFILDLLDTGLFHARRSMRIVQHSGPVERIWRSAWTGALFFAHSKLVRSLADFRLTWSASKRERMGNESRWPPVLLNLVSLTRGYAVNSRY